MLVDNHAESEFRTYEWLEQYQESGSVHIVTGYFTVGALAYFASLLNHHITQFQFVLGDIVHTQEQQERPLDLLNENITIEAALHLSTAAKQSVAFLQQDNVQIKTLEPNFCHAKVYLFHHASNRTPDHYFLTGSSNLTEAGIGLKPTHNVELNVGGQGSEPNYRDLRTWFKSLWSCPQAHDDKLVDGQHIPFKDYLIHEIQKLFVTYTPKELYYKVLFELFGSQVLEGAADPDFNRQIGRLENTRIYRDLYEFQRKGALSLIKMLQKYNGAILADAVGLGKTWSALAVMKFFQLEGFEVIVLCPKKLEQNWRKYLAKQYSRFEDDRFDYTIRFHTDLQDTRLERYQDNLKIHEYFQSDRPKLLVIDESHNLRNAKSNRYKFLVDTLLKTNDNLKVLMLSATPINNTLLDIRNQFKLMVHDDAKGFKETLGIQNIDYTFRTAQRAFHEWRAEEERTIGEFIKRLPANFFKLTDSLTVARTRKMVAGETDHLFFPTKAKPVNLFVTPKQIGHFDTFEELFDHFPPMLSGYQPAFYVEQTEDVAMLHDERMRDRFLVKMMYILLVKRLESSWFSFMSTVEKVLAHHENALRKINAYQAQQADDEVIDDTPEADLFDEDDEIEAEEFTLGKKRKVKLSDIARAGNLDAYRQDLKQDIESLDSLRSNVVRFHQAIQQEIHTPRNHHSQDTKLQTLIEQIQQKRRSGNNDHNQKVLIFTVFADTAFYLFDQLKQRGFSRLAVVSGGESRTDDSEHSHKNFEPILERFAPYTKLFMEKEWPGFTPPETPLPEGEGSISPSFGGRCPELAEGGRGEVFNAWKTWISERYPSVKAQLENPIDILIATDCLSEGQNLQDCDFVINYDIHWNPVRIIQRMGRIDRLGSPNTTISGVNFWPSDNINAYLNLQNRIENRMIAMKLAGAEVDKHFTETLTGRIEDEQFEQSQKERMMRQMEISWDDIEVSNQGLGFEDLSLESFRQDLAAELQAREAVYRAMPNGLYTGFQKDPAICPQDGLIALLGYPSKPPGVRDAVYASYELIYIDAQGHGVILNQKGVLEALAHHKECARWVPDAIDRGEADAIQPLKAAITSWLRAQAVAEQPADDGTARVKMGHAARDVLEKLKSGDREAVKRLKQNVTVEEAFQADNFDLIVWFVVS